MIASFKSFDFRLSENIDIYLLCIVISLGVLMKENYCRIWMGDGWVDGYISCHTLTLRKDKHNKY